MRCIVRRAVLYAFVVIMLLVAVSLPSQRSKADSPIDVIDQSTKSDFRHSFTFHLAAHDATGNIANARIYWQTRRTDPPASEMVTVPTPGPDVDLSFTWNTSQMTTPPWQFVTYHWDLTDDSGTTTSLPETQGEMSDATHDWQKLTDNQVSVYYYNQSDTFGKQLLDVAQKGFARVVETTGYTPKGDLRVVMYNTEADFCSFWAQRQCADWIAGVTFGSVTVQWLDPTQESFVMQQVVPHELSHAFLNDWLGARIIAVPRWFNEGQAVNNELQGVPDELQTAHEMAVSFGLQRLAIMDSFPTAGRNTSTRVANWYAESTSLVYYMYQEYGVDSLGRVLDKVKAGETFDQAIQDITGLTMDAYERAWRQWLGANSSQP